MRIVVVLALAGAILFGVAAPAGLSRSAGVPCRPQRLDASYSNRVRHAVLAKQDVWGDALLKSPGGPTYEAARRYLHPLLLAKGPHRRPLTDSGVYYLAFGQPAGPGGRGPIGLHLADGSEIVSDRADGPKLTLTVGEELFGSCLARLATPRLYGGFYPILETTYVDANGVRFEQESFAARVPQARTVVSFVRLKVEVPPGSPPEQVRFVPSETGLEASNGRLVRGPATYLFFSPGGRFDGSSLAYTVGNGLSTIYLARLVRPGPSEPIAVDAPGYERARQALTAYWDGRLARGMTIDVPDARVQAAERNLLIQNLLMTWRYSLGNPYEAFEFPESLETATVMGEYGFGDVDRAIVETSLHREPHLYPGWEAGSRLLAAARSYLLDPDRSFVAAATPALARDTALLRRRQLRSGLLAPEKYTADLPDVAYGLNAQAVAWQGLSAMAAVWTATGHPQLAAASRATAARLRTGLRAAVERSAVRLPDGSLFLPARLLDGERPYDLLADSRAGSYWNLVVQDALASGFFPPHGREARGALMYMLLHGSRLLGLVRGGAYALYGANGGRSSGTDEVYGLNVARFLADNDEPDQLVLSLYGALAVGMTEGTFVSGEAASVSPRPGEYDRAMYLPPNSTSNAAFLETLRLMLVHERPGADGRPRGLDLAYATPRAWLGPGRRIEVRGAPTSAGPVSFTLESARDEVRAELLIPARARSGGLSLRLRRHGAWPITRVELGGRPYRRFDPATGTIDLAGHAGRLALTVRYGR